MGNQISNFQDEIIDLVDAKDQVIGQEKRSIVIEKKLSNFRVINAFLVNPKGKLWIPRRSPHKAIFPSGLDFSVGGFVGSGESYETAMARELEEELNLEIAEVSCRILGHLCPHGDGVSLFMQVYEIRYDRSPDYNPNDFVEAFWLSPGELLDQLGQEIYPAKSDLAKLVRRFYR